MEEQKYATHTTEQEGVTGRVRARGRMSARRGMNPGFRSFEVQYKGITREGARSLNREEMIDLLLTSYADTAKSAQSYLHRHVNEECRYLFAVTAKNEGMFLIWDSPDSASILNQGTFHEIVQEAKAAKLEPRWHVYAALAPYTGPGIVFYQL